MHPMYQAVFDPNIIIVIRNNPGNQRYIKNNIRVNKEAICLVSFGECWYKVNLYETSDKW